MLTPRLGMHRLGPLDFSSTGELTPVPREAASARQSRPASLPETGPIRRIPRNSRAPARERAEDAGADPIDMHNGKLSVQIGAICSLAAGLALLTAPGLPIKSRVALLLLAGIALAFYGILAASVRQRRSPAAANRVFLLAVLFEASQPAFAKVIAAHTGSELSVFSVLPLGIAMLVVVGARLQPTHVLIAGFIAALELPLAMAVSDPEALTSPAVTAPVAWFLALSFVAYLATRRLSVHVRAWRVERARGRRVERELERYLSPDVARSILTDDSSLAKPERVDVTVLFCDLRGFTFMCERERPEDVVELLNTVYEGACKIISNHGGTVNKFLGDGLLALFGAPHPLPEHAQAAANAAREIQQLVRYLRNRGGIWTHLAIGMGLDTGEVVAGPIGATNRVEYTAIGSPVNRAARLQGFATRDSQRIIVSDYTARALAATASLKRLGSVELKGFTRAEEIYALR